MNTFSIYAYNFLCIATNLSKLYIKMPIYIYLIKLTQEYLNRYKLRRLHILIWISPSWKNLIYRIALHKISHYLIHFPWYQVSLLWCYKISYDIIWYGMSLSSSQGILRILWPNLVRQFSDQIMCFPPTPGCAATNSRLYNLHINPLT